MQKDFWMQFLPLKTHLKKKSRRNSHNWIVLNYTPTNDKEKKSEGSIFINVHHKTEIKSTPIRKKQTSSKKK